MLAPIEEPHAPLVQSRTPYPKLALRHTQARPAEEQPRVEYWPSLLFMQICWAAN